MAISIGDALLKIGVDKGSFDRDMSSLSGTIQKHRKAIGVAMTAAGAAIVGGFALALKSAADFETAMRTVNTMMGLSQEEFADLSKDVQHLASDLGVDAVESANALYQAISAGIPKENVLEFLQIATKAAIGGMTDTETAVDGLTTVLNAFKLPLSETQRVADIMFTTVKGGKTTFEELSASLFNVAPIAAASGVKFEEVAAALATMTKQGVPTSVATTQLRQAIIMLQKPTADMNKIIQELGFSSAQAMLEEKGLSETLNILRDATGGSTEMLNKMFSSSEAVAAVLSLTGESAQTFADDLEAMANSTGAATDALDEMERSASRRMAKLKSSFKDISISVGNVLLPILTDIVDKIKPIIDSIKNWIAEHPGLTKVIVIVVAALGTLMAILGPLLIILPGLTAALPLLGLAFHAALGPIGLITAAIAAVIAIGVLVVKNWDWIKEKALMVWTAISDFFKTIWDNIVGFFRTAMDWIKQYGLYFLGLPGVIIKHWGAIAGFFKGLWAGITDIFNTSINWIIDRINTLIGWINKIPFIDIGEIGHIGEPEIPVRVPPVMSAAELFAGPAPATSFKTANITVELDKRTLTQVLGQQLVDDIRLRQGVRQ